MKKTVILLFLLAGLVILNIYFFNKAWEFSNIYPFKRIIIENILTNKINFDSGLFEYKSKIIKIENNEVNSKNIFHILSKYKNKKEINISVIDKEKIIINTTLNPTYKNYDYLFFLICLLFFASIHYIWACIVYFFRPCKVRTILFCFSSLALSLFFFNAVDLFTYNNLNFCLPVIILLIGFLTILLGYNLATRRLNKYIIGSIILCIVLFLVIQISFKTPIDQLYACLFIFLMFCIIYLSAYFLFIIMKRKKPYITRRYSMVFLGICIGYLLPVSIIINTFFSESDIPFYFYASISLIFPLILGNSFLRYSQYDFYGYKIIQRKDLRLFSYNILATLLISLLLFSIAKISDFSFFERWYIIISIIIILFLLNILHFINNTNKLEYENKDNYAFSAQKIAESGSSPDTLENKLNFIFNEISKTTGAQSLKLIVFMDSNYDYYSNLNEYIEILPKNSDIFSFVKENNEIILRYTLINNSGLEGKVYKFLKNRNSILIITVMENEKFGVLLVGEQSGNEYYSFADIHYLKSMTNQVFQLIYNDWLHNDYILKKQYENELDNASYVQMRLFPKVSLDRDRGMDISFFYRPYLRVIGDYFDFFKLDEDHTAIIIGDVSGHGLSTAMILSAVNGITNAMLREVKAIEKTCYEINNFLNNSYKGIELITLFIGIFNKKTKILEYINAGHGAPLLIKKNEKTIQQIEGRTKILGADPEAKYMTSSLALNQNDELILYTDGVMEIYNEDTGAGINEEDFIRIIYDNIGKSIDSKIIEIEKSIKTHSEAIRDDITIIGVKIH